MITEETLISLRNAVEVRLSARRFAHTLGVERAARKIGAHCLPDKIAELSAAALLHDAAKELPRDEQLALMRSSGINFSDEDYASEALYHAFVAPVVVKTDFSELASEEILSAVFLHTSGGADMSVFDEIIFLADFVEDGREYDACREIGKQLFWGLEREKNTNEKLRVLHHHVLLVIDFTINYLEKKGRNVNKRMLLARNAILSKLL